MTPPQIINRGRGPEIAETRITVYDIMDYTRTDWDPKSIAIVLGISSEEVLTAIRYIEEHKEEVTAEHDRILARDAAGNPPELQARLEETHRRVQQMLKERSERKLREEAGAGTPGGR